MNLKDITRKANNSAYRPEQFKLQEMFKIFAPNLETEMEYRVFDTNGVMFAKIDLADLTNKIAYRLDGGSHTNKVKDTTQREKLEDGGWIVIDIKRDSYEWYWLW